MKTRRLVLILFFAFAARLVASLDAFWLDEIWSYDVARESPSLLEFFRRAFAENSHILTGLWMRILGPDAHAWLYRLPQLVFSCATVWLAISLGHRLEGARGRWIYALVFGFSYMLLHYGTEARGYSELVFHVLLGFWILNRSVQSRPSSAWNAAFALNAVLGLLSQPIFAMFLLGSGTWSVYRFIRELRDERRRFLRDTIERFLPPFAVLMVPHLLGVALQSQPAGPAATLTAITRSFLHFSFGVPPWRISILLTAGLWLLLAYRALRSATSASERSSLWLLGLLCLSPFAVLGMSGSEILYERYLIPALPFLYILAIRGALETYDRLRPFRRPLMALFAAYLAGNIYLIVTFLDEGRGHYGDAVELIAAKDPSPVIRVGTDHPFRTGTVIRFYSRRLDPPRDFAVLHVEDPQGPRPEWLLVHRIEDDGVLPRDIIQTPAAAYERIATFGKFGPSGWHWFLYRRLEGTDRKPTSATSSR